MLLQTNEPKRLGNFSPLSKKRELGLIDQEIARRQSPATPIPSLSKTDSRLALIDQEIARRKEAAPKVKERGVIGELAAGFGRGALGVIAAPAEIADIAGEAIGWEALEKAGESGAKAIEKYIKESPKLKRTESISKNILKNPELWKDPRWYSSIVGEGLPTILSMFIPGMAAAKAAKVAKLGAKGVRAARIAGGLTAGVGLEAAGAASDVRQYEEQTGEAVPISTKLKSVLGTGIVAGSLEYVPIFAMFGKAGASKLVGRVLTGMATEGTTEGAQELVANAFAKAGYDADQNMVNGVVESIVGGVLLGGGMGAVSRATNFKERVDETNPEEVSEILEQTEIEANIPEEQQTEFTRRREETALRTAEERQAAIEAAAPMTTASDETTTLAEEAVRPESIVEEIVPEEVVPEEIPLVPGEIPAPLRAMGMRPAPTKPAVEKAAVPFMITRETEAGLSKLGYTKKDIGKMSPEDAFGLVEGGITKEPVAEEKVVEPEAPEKIEIPTLTDTTQAIAFGKKATPEQKTELKRLRKESEARYDVLIKEDKLDEAGKEALRAQLYREAFEAKEKPKEPWETTKEKAYGDFIKDVIDKGETVGDKKDVIAEIKRRQVVTTETASKYYDKLLNRKKASVAATKRGERVDVVFDDKIHAAQYWLTTQQEYIDLAYEPKTPFSGGYDIELAREDHKAFVEEALKYKEPVPKEVLAEYPDLVPAKPITTKPPEPTPPEAARKKIKVEPIPEVAPKVEKKPEPGFAWIKGKQKPILSAREITKGKNKGKYEVTLTKGRDEEGNIIPGAKKIVTEKEIITMPEVEEKIKEPIVEKPIKPIKEIEEVKLGFKTVEVLDGRKKAVIDPRYIPTAKTVDYIIDKTGLNEITVRDTKEKKDVPVGEQIKARKEVIKQLKERGWKPWEKDKNIWRELWKPKKPIIPGVKPKVKKEKIEVAQGDKIRFIPDEKMTSPVEGIVQDVVSSTTGNKGFNVSVYTKEDPYRVVRVWENKGKINILEKVKVEPKKPKIKVEEIKKPKELNPADYAAELKGKGIGRRASWSEWVKRTNLKPGMDAKDWYKIYDSVTPVPAVEVTPIPEGKEITVDLTEKELWRKDNTAKAVKKEIDKIPDGISAAIEEIKIFGSYLKDPVKSNDIDIHIRINKEKADTPEAITEYADAVETFFEKEILGKKVDLIIETDEVGMGFERGKGQILYTKPAKPVEKAKIVKPVIPGVKPKVKKEEKPIRVTDKSVRDHTQRAAIGEDIIKITSMVGRKKAGEYSFNINEWEETLMHPNPSYAKKKLIEKYTKGMDEEPGGPEQADRIRDSQIYAINKAFKKIAKVTSVEEATSRIKASTTEILKGERGSFSTKTKEGAATFEDFSVVGKDFIKRGADTFAKFTEQMKKTFGEVWESVKHLAKKLYTRAKAILTEERGEITIREEQPIPLKEEPKVKKLTPAEKAKEAFKVLGIKPRLKPEEPLPKRARSVGLAYQDISEEAKRLEVEMGLEYPKVTRTHAELREQADRIMGDQEQLIKTMEKEKNFTEAEGLVVRRAAATGLESLMKVVATKDIKKANEIHKEFKEGVGKQVQDLHSEFGRNLESLKEKVSPESMSKAFASLERDLNKDDMDMFNSAAEALGQGNAKPMINFQKYLKTTKQDPKIMDYVYEYWYNSILSGVPTHVVNVASNTAWGAWQVGVHKPLLAAIDPIIAKFQKRPTEYYMAEVIPALAGIKRGLKPGIKGAKEVIVKGYTTDAELDKFAADMGSSVGAFARSPNKHLRTIAPFLTMPTRALRAMDIWAKQMNYEAELGSVAKRMEKQGKGKYEELLKNPTKDMMNEASQYADYTTFMEKLGKIGTMVEKLRTAVPGGRFIVPFVRTIANLVKRGVEMTPGVGAMKLMGGKVKGKEVTQVLAKQIEGAMIALVVASMFDDDEITGDVPANKAEREAFYRQGKKPWSALMGDRWYQYRRIEPFNTPIAAVAILYDTWKRTGEEPSTEFAYRAAAGFVNNIIDSSYLSGLTQVLDSVRKADKWPQKLTNMFDKTLASFSPMSSFQRSFVRAIEAMDKEGAILRKPKGAVETVAAATPFLSEMVPARKDVWGKEIMIVGTPLEQWLPWKTAKETDDVVEIEIERLHGAGLMSYPGMPAKYMSIGGKRLDLDDEQFDALITESGQASKKKLDSLVGTKYWGMLSDKEKASRIQKIIKDNRKKARNKIKKEFKVAIPGMVPWKKTKKKKRPAWQETTFGKKAGWQKPMEF